MFEKKSKSEITERILKVNELLRKEMGGILLREFTTPENVIVTVTRADTSPNLQQAKIYISVMPEERGAEILKLLERDVYDMQQVLNKRLNMRPVPRIEWFLEEKKREAQTIEEILDKIKEDK
ncbi:MAG: ribosome-binding factor A [bacterium]|nr:ribosome-binding factor A [bacterium]